MTLSLRLIAERDPSYKSFISFLPFLTFTPVCFRYLPQKGFGWRDRQPPPLWKTAELRLFTSHLHQQLDRR
jgi:hypothetical protein